MIYLTYAWHHPLLSHRNAQLVLVSDHQRLNIAFVRWMLMHGSASASANVDGTTASSTHALLAVASIIEYSFCLPCHLHLHRQNVLRTTRDISSVSTTHLATILSSLVLHSSACNVCSIGSIVRQPVLNPPLIHFHLLRYASLFVSFLC